MPDYLAFQLDDKTLKLVKWQNIQLLLVNDDGREVYVADGTVADAETEKGAAFAFGVAGFERAGNIDTLFPSSNGWKTCRFRSLRSGSWWSRDLPRDSYAAAVVTVADKDNDKKWDIDSTTAVPVLKLAKGDAWTDDLRREFYWGQIEHFYPHLAGLRDSKEPASALRAEAATMLAMLEYSEELKDAGAKETRTARAKTIMGFVPTLSGGSAPSEARQALVSNPLRLGRQHMEDFTVDRTNTKQCETNDAHYVKFFENLWTKLEEAAGTNYGLLNGQGRKPRVRIVAVGDGGSTNGLLNKPNESVGFVPYAKPTLLHANAKTGWKSTSAVLPAVDGGKRTVLHIFVTGLNAASPTSAATVTVKVGTRTPYKFTCAKLDTAGAKLTPVVEGGYPKSRKIRIAGVDQTVWTWEDGTSFDPSVNDLSFPLATFLTGDATTMTASATAADMGGSGLDEMMVGFFVVESYRPVALLGLFAVDKHIPLKPAEATGTAARERLALAYEQIDEIVAICLSMATYEVSLVAGGPGLEVSGGLIQSATQDEHTTLMGGKNLDGSTLTAEKKQNLRASFLDIEVKAKHVRLIIPSYTDPDYHDKALSWEYNRSLSARRSWGLLGLVVKKMAETDKAKAKALWDVAKTTDTDPAGREDYLATPGALNPTVDLA